MRKLKILHTSDWHLGRSLYEKKRNDEFSGFLEWLISLIKDEQIDILLVAGDVFDTTTPNNLVQEMYYRFLADVSKTGCRHVVITGGNHDSPSFLNAPKMVLQALNVHVVGDFSGNPEDEIVILTDESGETDAIVCAVPYLRDRDVRTAEAGESQDDKRRKLIEGISGHYATVAQIALKKRIQSPNIPIIGMGHLFTSGGKTTEGDGVRELYVGTLAQIDEGMLPGCFDYLALGHLHSAQTVGNSEFRRYSGSPIPMGFGEAAQEKKVIVAEFGDHPPVISEHIVPRFRELERISGGRTEILNRIDELKSRHSMAYLEIEVTDPVPAAELIQMLEDLLEGSQMEICKIKNQTLSAQAMLQSNVNETLDDLSELDVFTRLLDDRKITDLDKREELLLTFREILHSMKEKDVNAD